MGLAGYHAFLRGRATVLLASFSGNCLPERNCNTEWPTQIAAPELRTGRDGGARLGKRRPCMVAGAVSFLKSWYESLPQHGGLHQITDGFGPLARIAVA